MHPFPSRWLVHMIARTVTDEDDIPSLKIHCRCVDLASTFGDNYCGTRVMVRGRASRGICCVLFLALLIYSQLTTMDQHASALLKAVESWDWPKTYRTQASAISVQFIAITPKLLSGFISESQGLGGTLLDQFWDVVSQCHPILAANGWPTFPPA